MDTNPFLKRLMKDETEDVMHSSAYANAQNAGGFGATSAESFAQRMNVAKNREYVRAYGESQVAGVIRNNTPRPTQYGATRGGVVGGQKPLSRSNRPPMRRNPGISR